MTPTPTTYTRPRPTNGTNNITPAAATTPAHEEPNAPHPKPIHPTPAGPRALQGVVGSRRVFSRLTSGANEITSTVTPAGMREQAAGPLAKSAGATLRTRLASSTNDITLAVDAGVPEQADSPPAKPTHAALSTLATRRLLLAQPTRELRWAS